MILKRCIRRMLHFLEHLKYLFILQTYCVYIVMRTMQYFLFYKIYSYCMIMFNGSLSLVFQWSYKNDKIKHGLELQGHAIKYCLFSRHTCTYEID